MERKIIQQGAGGHTIYLPSSWVKQKGLAPGETVHVIEVDNALLIDSGVKGKKTAEVALNDDNRGDIRHILTHLYRAGFDEIVFRNPTKEDSLLIERLAGLILLGFEVTDRSADRLVVANLSEPSSDKYDAMLHRIFFITKETIELIVRSAELGEWPVDEAEHHTDQLDKLVLFCRRVVAKERNVQNPILRWELLTHLMHIQHACKYFVLIAKNNNYRPGEDALELIKELGKYYELLYNAHFKNDENYVHKINKKRPELHFGVCNDLLAKAQGRDAAPLSYLREIFRMIQLGSSPILVHAFESRYGS